MISSAYLRSIQIKRPSDGTEKKFPYNLPALSEVDKLTFHPHVTFFVGENGSGKSTLLEAIALACDFGPEGGSQNLRFSTVEAHSNLYRDLRLVRGTSRPKDGFFLRAESMFNVATQIDALGATKSYGGKSLHAQSHGESFLALMTERLRGQGLYIFDEPEAALSPQRQMTFLAVIHKLVMRRSQFIIATHSPIVMAYPNAQIYLFDDQGIRQARYEDTQHFKVTRDFLMRREKMLDQLLADS